MVHVRLITPALAQLLDAAANEHAAEETLREFMKERLCALVHTQSPSQLENALWIYLVAQQQLLPKAVSDTQTPNVELEANKDMPESRTTQDNAGCLLPPSLHLPECVTCISDAVRWYCGESSSCALPPIVDASHTASTASQGTQPRHPSQRAIPYLKQEPRALPVEQPGALIDELLRHRQQPTSSSAPQRPSPMQHQQEATQHLKQVCGPLATVQLAIDALTQAKHASVLLQPRTLLLLVRDLVALWSLVFLCKQLKRHQLQKERLLTGTTIAPVGAGDRKRGRMEKARYPDSTHSNRKPNIQTTDSEPITTCFHDYDLLLPWDLVQRVLSPSPVAMETIAAQCRAMEKKAGESTSATSAAAHAPFSIIINPAVTDLGDNPYRLRKNARIDAIDKAAAQYYYAVLSSGAHGQTGVDYRSPPTAASAALAATHQETLRCALTAVDVGEYGVLDPSRMSKSSLLGCVGGSRLGSAVCESPARSEVAAKSYALFLRDASIGFDIQVMSLTGAGVGYYLGYLSGLSLEWCTCYAVVGLVTMMLVDAVLLIIQVGRQDEGIRKARQRIRRQRDKIEREGEKLAQSMQASAGLVAVDATEDVTASSQGVTDPLTKKRQ